MPLCNNKGFFSYNIIHKPKHKKIMGGFTSIYLKDTSINNIRKQNEKLREYGVAKKYHFYSDDDIRFEYEAFKNGEGIFPADQFPRDLINTFKDFKKYWSPKALGRIFCPDTGSLNFDCYFGRTSKRAMRNMGKYVYDHAEDIKKVSGSFTTFIERGMTKREREYIEILLKHGDIKEGY